MSDRSRTSQKITNRAQAIRSVRRFDKRSSAETPNCIETRRTASAKTLSSSVNPAGTVETITNRPCSSFTSANIPSNESASVCISNAAAANRFKSKKFSVFIKVQPLTGNSVNSR